MEFDRENHNPTDDFEQELSEAFARRPAPPNLKRKIMARRSQQNTERIRNRTALLQRLAACLVLCAALAGGFAWTDLLHQYDTGPHQYFYLPARRSRSGRY